MKKLIFGICILIFIFLIFSFANNNIFLNKSNIKKVLKGNEYSIIYLGNKTKQSEESLKSFSEIGGLKSYYTKLSYKELNSIFNLSLTDKTAYVIFSFDSYVGSMDKDLSNSNYIKLLKFYLFDTILDEDIKYIVPNDVDNYIKLLKSNDYTVSVFGKTDCYYCTLYLPIVNKVATDYNIDIYYLDSQKYDQDSYNKIMDLDYTIPASCTTKNIETSFKKGFAKPTTIITKKGKIVGCIKGYVSENTLVEKLNEFKLLEE